jgi:hypothetical protein
MMKSSLIIGVLVLLASCQKAQETSCPHGEHLESGICVADIKDEVREVSEVVVDDDNHHEDDHSHDHDHDHEQSEDNKVPYEAFLFDADINFRNFKKDDELKVEKAVAIIKKVVRSQEFKNRVINFQYKGKKAFIDNDGLSNAEIYQKLLNGAETLRPVIDHKMDLDLELYYSRKSTVGYTYPSGLRIWMNRKFFNHYTPAEVAGNLFHEWTHKLGFTHAARHSVSRDSSVPYALGYLIEELGKKYE